MIDELLDTVGPLVRKNNNTLTVHCSDDVGIDELGSDEDPADPAQSAQQRRQVHARRRRHARGAPAVLEGAQVFVEFTVTDTGVGMTAEQTQKIFDAFTQADVTTTRKYGGTGLGLALVSRFCELMGGSVSVESRPDEGSRFTFAFRWRPRLLDVPAVVGA